VGKRHPLTPQKKCRFACTSVLILGLPLLFVFSVTSAQNTCPPNIDFENGTFANWQCYMGYTMAVNGANVIQLLPTSPGPGRHTLFNSSSNEVDPYGGFPVNCPNGSGNSIRLGNDMGGGEAEGISYQFTIPPNQNEYSLIYHYAVVFQDPAHAIYQQPRMVVEISNVTDGEVISCSSFTFIPFGSPLPGFFQSTAPTPDGTPVWCKDWSAVSVKLNNLAGKTIQLMFKTADCTFRRHFGYAYIDVNSECSSEFVGASFCPDDTAVTVTAPYGYQAYKWYSADFSQVLGTEQTLRFFPPPSAGTTVAVQVTPYDGYGCADTLYAKLLDNLKVNAVAGPDALYCGDKAVSLGVNPKPGLVYSWSPTTGLSNANIANPQASPGVTTTYCLSVRNGGGGCLNTDTITVTSSVADTALSLLGKSIYCLGNNDSAVLRVNPARTVQWFKDGSLITGAGQDIFRVTQSGAYYARVNNNDGCIATTRTEKIFIDQPRPGITYPLEYAVNNTPYQLQAREFGTKVQWTPSFYLSNASIVNPQFQGARDQSYNIRIETVTGCITVDTLLVKTAPAAGIFVPTAFTPNSDGRNDRLFPVLMGIRELRYFRIFNRWGQLLYETKQLNTGWDGRINGVLQSLGAVVWVAEAVGADKRVYQQKGTTVIVR